MKVDYEGFYARFETISKKDAGILMGADTLVGDEFTTRFDKENPSIAYIENKFGKTVGYFEEQTSRQIKLYEARGWSIRILLAFLAYSDHPEPGCYWGQMAILAYPKECEEFFTQFVSRVSKSLCDGKRIDVNIGQQGIKSLVDSNGSWFTNATLKKPDLDTGTVMMKSSRSLSEKAVELGRDGNKGCYVVSWIFIIGLVVLLFLGLRSCGVF